MINRVVCVCVYIYIVRLRPFFFANGTAPIDFTGHTLQIRGVCTHLATCQSKIS